MRDKSQRGTKQHLSTLKTDIYRPQMLVTQKGKTSQIVCDPSFSRPWGVLAVDSLQ